MDFVVVCAIFDLFDFCFGIFVLLGFLFICFDFYEFVFWFWFVLFFEREKEKKEHEIGWVGTWNLGRVL